MFKLTKFTLFSTLLFIALFSIKPAFAKSELLNVVTVCKRGCDYKNMQTAVNYSSSDDLIVIKEMMYGKAAAFTVTGAPRHNINIICEPGAGLNAYKLNTLIAGSKASPLTISSCILKGAKSYLLDVNTSPYVLNLRNNSLEGAKVKSGYGATLTANRFDNVEVESALAGVTIINNTFRSTKNGLTALKLYPTGTSNVLHNSFDGYDTVMDLNGYGTYKIYNNLISRALVAYKIVSGANIDTYNTLNYKVVTLRQAAPNSGTDFELVTQDPHFSDELLHVYDSSPAVDRGDPAAGVILDKDGRARSGIPDIGAFEVN